MDISRTNPAARAAIPTTTLLVEARAAAGFPSPAADYKVEQIDLNHYLMPRPAASFLLWASGDSMVDAGILDGDLLVVDRSITPTSGQIVVAVLDGGLVLKRLVRRGAVWWLAAANRNYPDLRIGEFSETVIWGVAVYAIHRLNGQDARGAARRTGEPSQPGRLL